MKKPWVEGYNHPSKAETCQNQSPQHPNNYNIWTYWDIMSLDIMELVMQMQEELDCKIELSQEITTIDKLVELIEKQ